VLVVDDSAVSRNVVTRILESDPGIRVVASAADSQAALLAIASQPIDVVILDIEMPGMTGLELLPLLIRERPGVRVIMASILTTRGATATLEAMRLGAADYVAKPSAAMSHEDGFRNDLLSKVKGLASAGQGSQARKGGRNLRLTGPPAQRPVLLAVGSSTGGPQALFTLFQALGPNLPVPIVITQHMPPTFIPILAEQLTRLSGVPVQVGQPGLRLLPGQATLAPGDRHMLVVRVADALYVELSDTPPESFCRPAVDPMLRSAAVASRGRTLVVILTGMGADGLAGTTAVVAAGGTALAQDEASSVVWGMPGAVAQAGLCHEVATIPKLAGTALRLLTASPGRLAR
jgi:two-component system chemotaxis response regulator CheB